MLTNEAALGDKITDDLQSDLRAVCFEALAIQPKDESPIPWSIPGSLKRSNSDVLDGKYYFATRKAVGTRYMMLLRNESCYLIDKDFNFRRVQMRFPTQFCKEDGYQWSQTLTHYNTLLDGKMVTETCNEIIPEPKKVYLINDILVLKNDPVVKKCFSERYSMIQDHIIMPRNEEQNYLIVGTHRDPGACSYHRYDLEPFTVRRKDFWPLPTVCTRLSQSLMPFHPTNGLVFQCWDDLYFEGTMEWTQSVESHSPDLTLDHLKKIVQTTSKNEIYKTRPKEMTKGCRPDFEKIE